MSDKWRKVSDNKPNLEGTEIGKVLEGLKQLQSHYEGNLQKDLANLAVLQQALSKWELQKKTRKADTNG